MSDAEYKHNSNINYLYLLTMTSMDLRTAIMNSLLIFDFRFKFKLIIKNRLCLLGILIILMVAPNYLIAQNNSCDTIHLIAHRGGVVDEDRGENSLSAIKEAINRKYWMIEIDLRISLDDQILLHHDRTFQRYYDESQLVSDMTWDEIKYLQSNVDGSNPLLFEEVVKLVRGKINLMLDIKGENITDSVYKQIEQILKKYKILSSTFLLGRSRVKSQFSEGEAFHSIGYEELMEALNAGEDVSDRFLFERGSNLNEEKILYAQENDVMVIAGINKFRYVQAGEDPWQGAKKDIERLHSLGVKYYQTDSFYEPLYEPLLK